VTGKEKPAEADLRGSAAQRVPSREETDNGRWPRSMSGAANPTGAIPRHYCFVSCLEFDHFGLVNVTHPTACVPVEHRFALDLSTASHIPDLRWFSFFFANVNAIRTTSFTSKRPGLAQDVARSKRGWCFLKALRERLSMILVKDNLVAATLTSKENAISN